MSKKIGVFICHCGTNIAGTVDVEKLRQVFSKYPGVVLAENYFYMCSDPGQKLIQNTIKEKKLDSVIVACCSPTLHETTFRKTCELAGLNPYQCEIANIREQCSWVHRDNMEEATRKAIKITSTMVEKVKQNESLEPISIPVTRRALVIGGGIAGIQAALDIGDAGYEVLLVERNPSIGGHMIQLSETFPTLDCSQCIMTPKMVEISRHPKIKLLTYSEIQEISGYIGNFNVKILKKPRYVIADKCTLCDKCIEVCPVATTNEFDQRLVARKAIYMPFPQAIPATFTIDAEKCPGFLPIACGKCADVCEPKAIDFDMQPEIVEEKIGAIVVATGYDLYSAKNLPEYGGGKLEDVLDGLQFERLLSATGPTEGEIRRLSDNKVPKRVVFLSCVGSRDTEHHKPYCSKICCMYMAKHAMLYKHKVANGEAIVFYIDVRAGGKGYEEFVTRAQTDDDVVYIRGKVSKIYRDNGKLVVLGVDTLACKQIEVECDMVVLSTAMIPSSGNNDLLSKLKIAADEHGFLSEAHPKLRPVESISAGFFVAGAVQAPKDIPETVAQASGAASKVTDLFSSAELKHEPIVAVVDEDVCSGCGVCIPLCPYGARELEIDGEKRVVKVNDVLCEGCGCCIAACPSGATGQWNFMDRQLYKMINAALLK
ncbi:Ferredoxin-type protein NapF [subsurface metagenome]